MSIFDVLKEKKDKVMPFLLDNVRQSTSPGLTDMMKDYPLRGGKYLRPALVLIVCEMFGENPDKAVRTAAALEIFQSWVLIHDDIEDESDDRRGKPCLHVIHGMPLALNAGDALHIVMWDVLLKNREILGDEKTFKVLDEFVNMLSHTVDGQNYEISWLRNNDWDVSEDDYFNMIHNKTSWYTVISPCRLGAAVAGYEDLDKFNEFGDNIGKAFQIQDDILNLVGDEAKYGKEIGGDIQEGKRTLILIHLLKSCSEQERKEVVEIMSRDRKDIGAEEVKRVIGLMEEKGSIEYAKQVALGFAEKAKKEFDAMGLPDNKASQDLRSLIDFVVDREL